MHQRFSPGRRIGIKLVLMLVLAGFAATSAYADITVTVLPSVAPNAFGSPSWAGYAANAVYAIQHGLSTYGDPNSPTYYSQTDHFNAAQTIVTGFPSWLGQSNPGAVFGPAYANELGNRMHFGVHIAATNGETFSLDDVSFDSVSTPNPGLNYGWSAGPWYFSPIRIGITSGGTVLTSGSSTGVALTELFYVGSGNSYEAYCSGCTPAQQEDAIVAAALDLGGDTYTGTYSVKDSAGVVFSGSGTFTVDAVPEPSSVVLFGSILAFGGVLYRRRRSA